MHPENLRIENYTYHLPNDKIARYPLARRDASKLLVYDDGAISEDIYRNIVQHIPEKYLLVLNQTKVIHARILFQKVTGGFIEVFCLEPYNLDVPSAMLQHKTVLWKCMIGGANKWKHGMVLKKETAEINLYAEITTRETDSFIVKLSWDNQTLNFAEMLQAIGKIPLPPYLHREAEATDEDRYQTTFAANEGSVAAPTAGLHFTENIFKGLAEKNIDNAFVTLHVGAGTFKPVKTQTIAEHEMHAEWIQIEKEQIEKIKNSKQIIAVGTTSLRTLESLYWIGAKLIRNEELDCSNIAVNQWDPYEMMVEYETEKALQAIIDFLENKKMKSLQTRTQIMIAPGYDFKIVKGLITNFHQPQSTLLLLVAAFIGSDWKNIYSYALEHNFRFLSYGDGCLLWKKP